MMFLASFRPQRTQQGPDGTKEISMEMNSEDRYVGKMPRPVSSIHSFLLIPPRPGKRSGDIGRVFSGQ